MQGGLSIERMCYLAQVSRASFYRSRQESQPVDEEMAVRVEIQQISLARTLAARLPIAALKYTLAERHPPPGLVHHSDRGIQYASEAYVTLLRTHHMSPSMSRPANPYDNASCESFMKTFKREEIYANTYRDLEHLRLNIEAFIEQYYNRARHHSALGYRPPEEFEHTVGSVHPSAAATIKFFQPAEGADFEGMKRARKNNRPTRVC